MAHFPTTFSKQMFSSVSFFSPTDLKEILKKMPAPILMKSLGISRSDLAVIALYNRMESLIKTCVTLKTVLENPNASIDTDLEKRSLQIRCLKAKARILCMESVINVLQYVDATQSRNLSLSLSIQLGMAVQTGEIYLTFTKGTVEKIDAVLKSLEVQKEELIIEDVD